jgi:hypothetical protein
MRVATKQTPLNFSNAIFFDTGDGCEARPARSPDGVLLHVEGRIAGRNEADAPVSKKISPG